MLVLAAWLSVGRATGRTVLVLPLSSFPGAERCPFLPYPPLFPWEVFVL